MADTLFTPGTTVTSTWLNDINDFFYKKIGNTATATQGAGMVGYNSALSYPANTVGNALQNITTSGIPHFTKVFSPWSYGAIGNGSTDDTAALQLAMDAAAAVGGAVLIAGNHSIGGVNIKNGVRAVIQIGGTLTLRNVANAGIRLLGVLAGEASNVNDLLIRDLNIDASGNTLDTVGIWGQNASAVRIIGCRIFNITKGYGILLRNHTAGGASGGGNLVNGNRITCSYRNTSGAIADVWGICVDSEAIYGGYADAPTLWKATFTSPTATQFNAGNVITGNRVIGGYYGLMLHGCVNSSISDNVMEGNQRGISMQNQASGNTVSGNKIFETFSSGIHLAYGSSDNNINGNEVLTYVGKGEALIQVYVGCERNLIVGNSVISNEATEGNKYGIYVAVHANENVVKSNVVRGRYLRASIGVESAWRSTYTTNNWHYGNGMDTTFNNFANAATTGVTIEDNTIYCDTTTDCPSIILSQIKTTGGTDCDLTATIVKGNTMVANGGSPNQLYLIEDTAPKLSAGRLVSNSFALPDSNMSLMVTSPGGFPLASTYFTLPRGRAHWLTVEGNDWFNSGRQAGLIEGTGFFTINLNLAGHLVQSATSTAGNIINGFTVDDGVNARGATQGQRFRLRTGTKDDLTHSTSNFKFRLAAKKTNYAQDNLAAPPAYNNATIYTAGQAVVYDSGTYYCVTSSGLAGILPGNEAIWRRALDSDCWIDFEIKAQVAFEIGRSQSY